MVGNTLDSKVIDEEIEYKNDILNFNNNFNKTISGFTD